MQPLAVIDFETANNQPGSACQLGIVLLEGWQVVGEYKWNIRPQRLYFSPRCVAVHGITAKDVMDCPTWDGLWGEINRVLDGAVILAHNAGFDARVLSSTCALYDLAIGPIDVQCTRLIAKKAWPSLRSHSLASMAEHLSIRFEHHDALEDAKAAATLLQEAARGIDAGDLEQLETEFGLERGRIWSDRIKHPRSIRRSRKETICEVEPRYEKKVFRRDGNPLVQRADVRGKRVVEEILKQCEGELPLAHKHIVLIGTILGLDREDSVGFLEQLGASVQSSVNMQTQYVVQGTSAEVGLMTQALQALGSRQRSEIERRSGEGQPLHLLSQRQLLALLPAGLQAARGDFYG